MATKRKSEGGDGRLSKYIRFEYNSTVAILVDKSEAPFTVHKDLICCHSEFFDGACGKNWKEGQGRLVRLPETHMSLFAIYVEKLYSPSTNLYLAVQGVLQLKTVQGSAPEVKDIVDELTKLWELGDYLRDSAFENTVMDILRWRGAALIESPGMVARIVSYTSMASPLSKWVLDALMSQLSARPGSTSSQFLEDLTGKLPADFLMELLKKRVAMGYKTSPNMADECVYHMHPVGTKRCTL